MACSGQLPSACCDACVEGASPFTVEIIASYAEFCRLESDWSSLLRASRCNAVFLTHEWLRCWCEAFGSGGQLLIVCVRDGGRLVGVAPLHLFEATFRGLPVRRLTPLSNSYSGSAGVVVSSPELPILRTMFSWLIQERKQWDQLIVPRIRDDSPLWEHRQSLARDLGLHLVTRPDIQVPYITVQGEWDAMLASHSRNSRKALRRRLNMIKNHPEPVRVVRVSSPDEILAVLPDVLAVSSRSWKAARGRALTDDVNACFFFERLSHVLGQRGWIDCWLVYSGSVPIAFEYHLNYEGVTSPIRADFDEQCGRLSPGAHLEYTILHRLFEDPARSIVEYNTCADGYAYERRWTSDIRSHNAIWVHTPTMYGRLLHGLSHLRWPRRKAVPAPMQSCREES